MWRIGRSLVEGEAGLVEADQERERKMKKLKVKYTQLAHDKVICTESERGRREGISGNPF